MDDPREPPPPLDYWREPPAVRPEQMPHWKGILVVVFILLAPVLLVALMIAAGSFR